MCPLLLLLLLLLSLSASAYGGVSFLNFPELIAVEQWVGATSDSAQYRRQDKPGSGGGGGGGYISSN